MRIYTYDFTALMRLEDKFDYVVFRGKIFKPNLMVVFPLTKLHVSFFINEISQTEGYRASVKANTQTSMPLENALFKTHMTTSLSTKSGFDHCGL